MKQKVKKIIIALLIAAFIVLSLVYNFWEIFKKYF